MVEIVVLDIAELELQLEVDVLIRIAPSLTATRYLLAKKETMTTVHLCSIMTSVAFFFCWAFVLLSCFICLKVKVPMQCLTYLQITLVHDIQLNKQISKNMYQYWA